MHALQYASKQMQENCVSIVGHPPLSCISRVVLAFYLKLKQKIGHEKDCDSNIVVA